MPNHNDPIYETYLRTHHEDHPLEIEHSKTAREKAAHDRRRRQNKQRWQQYLLVLIDVDPETVAAEFERLTAEDVAIEQELGNARTHKTRLQILRDRFGHN